MKLNETQARTLAREVFNSMKNDYDTQINLLQETDKWKNAGLTELEKAEVIEEMDTIVKSQEKLCNILQVDSDSYCSPLPFIRKSQVNMVIKNIEQKAIVDKRIELEKRVKKLPNLSKIENYIIIKSISSDELEDLDKFIEEIKEGINAS